MSDDNLAVTIHILDKEFRIACPEEEHDALLASAHFLDNKMKEIRDSGVVGQDRIAIMAALNLTHELLSQKSGREKYVKSMGTRIQSLQEKIEVALTRNKQLEL
ncbi:MAG: cell division protein ZapA [Sulfuriflexus sp.]|nr:cell division protein ZapA [Sulfuriflexus sp.]